MVLNTLTASDYMGELEQRIVDLEVEQHQLRNMIERIGREKRLAPSAWLNALIILIFGSILVNTGLIIILIIKG